MADSSSNEEKSATEAPKSEEDLDSLLDSALDDFTNLPKEKAVEKAEDSSKEAESAEQMFSEILRQAFQADPNIRDMFQQGSIEENAFVQDFSKIAEAAAKVMEGDSSTSSFANIMSETLRNLNENSESIQNQFGNPEELANMFQELGLNGGTGLRPDASIEDIPPFMQTIMQSFLSKEILYPSIKDFVDRYPAWLEEHKATLPPEQYDNYCKQLELMKKVVEEFDTETETDSEDTKKQRFQRIMGHMQQMQNLGHPPAELVGANLSLDESEVPSLPPGMDPNQCSTM